MTQSPLWMVPCVTHIQVYHEWTVADGENGFSPTENPVDFWQHQQLLFTILLETYWSSASESIEKEMVTFALMRRRLTCELRIYNQRHFYHIRTNTIRSKIVDDNFVSLYPQIDSLAVRGHPERTSQVRWRGHPKGDMQSKATFIVTMTS